MYNFAKLLTEEPEKLERLILLLLKFIMTLWITTTIFGSDITLQEIFNEDAVSKYNLTSILFFSFCFIITWGIVWLIGVGVIMSILINLLSKIGNSEDKLKSFLWSAGVIDINDKPKNNVIDFADELDDMAKKDINTYNETATRLFQYFSISLVAYIILLSSNEIKLSSTVNSIVIGVFILTFISLIILTSASNYVDESLLKLRKQFRSMAYFQMVNSALNTSTNYDYNIDTRTRRIFLEKKEDFPYPPIRVTPLYVWNYNLGEKKMIDDLKRAHKNISTNEAEVQIQNNPVYNVIVTNIKPDSVREFISKLDMGIFIYAETREDINNGIEEMFYKINNENQERLIEKASKELDNILN